MSIRVVCAECHSKLDIRDELAGAKRRCPKCKTEFVVPTPVASEVVAEEETSPDEAVPTDQDLVTARHAVEDSADQDEHDSEELSSPLIAPVAADSAEDEENSDDEEDLDYLPGFVTAAAPAQKPKPSGKPAPRIAKAADEDDEEEEDDDDEPVLAIPKIPDPPKRKALDPAFLGSDDEDDEDDEEDEPPKKAASSPPGRKGPKISTEAMDDFFAKTYDKPLSTPDFKLPTPNRGAAKAETPSDTRNVTKDRAQAARELRQALKDSALNQATVGPQKTAGIGFDIVEFFQDFGLKGLAILIGGTLLTFAVYYASNYAMGGAKRPPLGRVAGILTMDGDPVSNARIYFRPESETSKIKDMKRTSIGTTDQQGKFSMMYEQNIPGVAVGKCRVWMELPHPLRVPPEYTVASTTTVDVAKGSQTIDFPLKSKAKK